MSSQQPLPDNTHLRTVLIAGRAISAPPWRPWWRGWRRWQGFCSSIPTFTRRRICVARTSSPANVGKPKAPVQAARLRRINPAIDARAFCCRVESLPLGLLWSADVVASGLDSRISRQYVSQAAWRLGVPLIDGAVDASRLLVRANVYVPGPNSGCLECGWDNDDYDSAALEQPYPCQPRGGGPASTNSPASLGHIAAGLMAVECQKLLAGDREHLLAGRQVMLDLRHHTHYITAFRRGHCRFDHEIWQVEHLDDSPTKMTLGEAVRRSADGSGYSGGRALRVEGQQFATMQFCSACGTSRANGHSPGGSNTVCPAALQGVRQNHDRARV